jgi:hypothetical protein
MRDWLVNIELDIKEFMNKISERKGVLIEKWKLLTNAIIAVRK